MRKALMVQYNALKNFNGSQQSNSANNFNKNWGVLDWPYYGSGFGGCCRHHSHCGGISNVDGDAAIIFAVLVFLAAGLAAVYGMATDLAEMSREMYNGQRVGANLATIALTGAAVVVMSVAAAALCASNPIVWAIIMVVFGAALVLKAARALVNALDGALEQNSGLSSDSRFQLTNSEELNLKSNMNYSDNDIDKTKGIIRNLARRAKPINQMGFFGSNEKYSEITKLLTEIKNGNISKAMKERWGITNATNSSALTSSN